MAKRGVAAEMRKHAAAAAEMVFEEYGHALDFSEPTIGAVEAILDGFWKEGNISYDLASNITLLFGSYIGELIREAFPKAKWVHGESRANAYSFRLNFQDFHTACSRKGLLFRAQNHERLGFPAN